jgi:cytochrome P450
LISIRASPAPRHQVQVVTQPFALVGMVDQGPQPAGDAATDRIVPGDDDDGVIGHGVDVGQRLAVDAGIGDLGRQIAGRSRAPRRGQSLEVREHLQHRIRRGMEQRRSHPAGDIITDLVTAEIDGEKLTDEAIYSFLRLLLPSGLETTYRSSGNLLYLLLQHQDQFAAVQQHRELIPMAIEEGLRYETPLTFVQRYVTEDTELAGVPIPAGAVLDVCLGSANRDENRWERAAEFDILRPHIPHISFTAGAHTCLGLHLARMETRVALECLLNRLTNITVLPDSDPHIFGQPFRSPTSLPVTFDVIA